MQIKMLWLRRALLAFLVVALPIPAVARFPQENAPLEQRKSVAGGTPASVAELERKRPVIVGVTKKYGPKQLGHYEVVIGINRQMQKIVTLDPGTGWSEDSFQGFLSEWLPAQQLTLVVSPLETQ